MISLREQIENGRNIGDPLVLQSALRYFMQECGVKRRPYARVSIETSDLFPGVDGVVAGAIYSAFINNHLGEDCVALAERLRLESPSEFERTAWRLVRTLSIVNSGLDDEKGEIDHVQ